jgi:tetratricopeptide (TPR) repeat protein
MSRKTRTRTQNKQQPAAYHVNKQPDASRYTLSRNWIIGLILAATFAVFANSINNKFAYDDTTQILQNESIRSFSNIPLILTKESWFWRVEQDKDPNKEAGPTTPYYRPLVMIYLMIGWNLFETWTPGWHVLSILLHLISVYFVFLILHHITKDQKLTAIATILFAIHPLRSESVAWISGATDLLLAVFMLPAFYLYLLYRRDSKKNYLVGSVILFLLGAFAKEPAIMLPFFIFVYETVIANQDRSLKDRLKPALAYSSLFALISVVYFIMRVHALGFMLNDKGFVTYPLNQVLMTIPIVICKYIGLTFWPANLSLFHATSMVVSPLDLRFIIPSLVLIVAVCGLWQLRRSLIARFAILWFAVNLLPVLNLGAFSQDFLVQERYIYVSSIGLSLLVAMGLIKIPIEKWFTLGSRRTAQAALVGLIALLLTGKTLAQNTVWKDDLPMWEHGAEVASDQAMPHYILGHKYFNLQEFNKMVEELERYMEINPNNFIVISNLASAHLLLYQEQLRNNPAQADRAHLDRIIALCEMGLAQADDASTLLDTLGVVYTFDTSLKNYDRAIWLLGRGLKQNPKNPIINLHLAGAFMRRGDVSRGDFDSALRYLKIVVEVQPNMADAYKFLAYAYKGKGQIREAVDNLNQYLQMQPNAPDAATISQQLKDLRVQLNNTAPQS